MNRNVGKTVLAAIVVSAALLGGCSSSRGGGGNAASQVQSVQMGTIQALREVTIESNRRLSSDTRAVEFTVRLDAGQTIAIVQPGSVNEYRVGDRVRVVQAGGTTRVER